MHFIFVPKKNRPHININVLELFAFVTNRGTSFFSAGSNICKTFPSGEYHIGHDEQKMFRIPSPYLQKLDLTETYYFDTRRRKVFDIDTGTVKLLFLKRLRLTC